jgi:RNA methyltransferase, TrmH family
MNGFDGLTPMITSRQNPLVKVLRKLHQSKQRHESQQFLLEGTHLVQEALKVQWPMDIVCHTPEWGNREISLLAALQASVVRVECVSAEVLQWMATTVHPDGVLAVGRSRDFCPSVKSCGPLDLLLDTIQDPGNFGTIVRTAAATDVSHIWYSPYSVDVENPKVLRASAGAWFQVPLGQCEVSQHMTLCRSQGMQIVATTPRAEQDYWAIDYTQPTLLVVGNEGAGLADSVLGAADHLVKIPIADRVESLNAAIATAVILYEAKRQRSVR